jgi:hypothetical protein
MRQLEEVKRRLEALVTDLMLDKHVSSEAPEKA